MANKNKMCNNIFSYLLLYHFISVHMPFEFICASHSPTLITHTVTHIHATFQSQLLQIACTDISTQNVYSLVHAKIYIINLSMHDCIPPTFILICLMLLNLD